MNVVAFTVSEFRRMKLEDSEKIQFPPKVLVVDDNEDFNHVFSEVLTSAGCEVQAAKNIDEAIADLKKNRQFTHAFIDLHFPDGLNGAKLISWIKSAEPKIPICIVTGHYSPELTEVAAEFGVKVIQKPIDFDRVKELIGANESH